MVDGSSSQGLRRLNTKVRRLHKPPTVEAGSDKGVALGQAPTKGLHSGRGEAKQKKWVGGPPWLRRAEQRKKGEWHDQESKSWPSFLVSHAHEVWPLVGKEEAAVGVPNHWRRRNATVVLGRHVGGGPLFLAARDRCDQRKAAGARD